MNAQLQHFQLRVPAIASAEDPDRDLKAGGFLIAAVFVVLLGWASLARLDAAALAPGSIAVMGNLKQVQHPTGGVVTAVHVGEGQKVKQGELLIELAAPELRAAERALTSDYLNLLAQRNRLIAELDGKSKFEAPAEFASLPPQDKTLADDAIRLQAAQLKASASTLAAQQGILDQQARQLREQQAGYRKQLSSTIRQQQLLADELDGIREIAKKGFASKNRVRALERAEAELQSQQAAMAAAIAKAGEGVGETRMQSLSVSRSKQEQLAAEIRETDSKLSEVLPRLISTREQLERAQVRAPAAGQVVGLSVFSAGAVVAPGQMLLQVVPDDPRLIIRAQVDPRDADDVYVGQSAQVKFSSVHDRALPLIEGRVTTISANSFTDDKTGRNYFTAEIEVEPKAFDEVKKALGNGQLRPGLPVDITLSVRKRTALEYLLEPLFGSFSRALHES